MSDQKFEDLCIVAGTLGSQAMLIVAGVYLVITEHYGWAWIPFLFVGSLSFRRSPTSHNPGTSHRTEK